MFFLTFGVYTTHMYHHIAALELYMIAQHIMRNMIGQTRPSTFVNIYRHHRHASLDRKWRAAARTHTNSSVKKRTDKTHTHDGGITQLMAECGLGWNGHVAFPTLQEKRDDIRPCKNVRGETGSPGRLLQGCGRCWAGVEPNGGKSHTEDATVEGWASGG